MYTQNLITRFSGMKEYGPDPFGAPLVVVGEEAEGNPFRFSTKYTDQETDLVYYGYRYYAPQVGRWLSRDPVGWLNRPLPHPLAGLDGPSLFAFLWNAPTRFVDVLGLWGKGGDGSPCPGHADFTRSDDFAWEALDEGKTAPNPLTGSPDLHFWPPTSADNAMQRALENCNKNAFQAAGHEGQDCFSHYNAGYRWAPLTPWKWGLNLGFGHAISTAIDWIVGGGTGLDPDDGMEHFDRWKAANDWTQGWVDKWDQSCCKDSRGGWVPRSSGCCAK